VAAGHSVNAANWRRVSALVLDRLAGRFTRVETRRTAAEFVTGLLADLEVKTSWQLAEHAGHDRPDAMQRLLYRAKWDADTVRDDVRQVVIDRLGDPDGVLVVDETGDLKKGIHSVAGSTSPSPGPATRNAVNRPASPPPSSSPPAPSWPTT
jgi:SRSO17 transposase